MNGKKIRGIIVLDILIIIVLISMFCFVKCGKRTAFTHKGEYKTVSLTGKWYKVDVDTVTQVIVSGNGAYKEKDMAGNLIKKGTCEVGNYAIKVDGKVFDLIYVDEAKELEKSLGEIDKSEYELRKYFIITNDDGKDIYYFSTETAAADQIEDNCMTNEYYEFVGLMDENDFAIDGDDSLVAYTGDEVDITVPSGAMSIAENAFAKDYDRALKTKKVRLSSTVLTIKSNAFSFSNIEKVYIAEGLKEIEQGAFSDSKIKEIHFPESVDTIGEGIFDTQLQVDNLKIYCKQGSPMDKYLKEHHPQGNYQIIYE